MTKDLDGEGEYQVGLIGVGVGVGVHLENRMFFFLRFMVRYDTSSGGKDNLKKRKEKRMYGMGPWILGKVVQSALATWLCMYRG